MYFVWIKKSYECYFYERGRSEISSYHEHIDTGIHDRKPFHMFIFQL